MATALLTVAISAQADSAITRLRRGGSRCFQPTVLGASSVFFLGERSIEKLHGLVEAQFRCPSLEGAIARALVVLDGLVGGVCAVLVMAPARKSGTLVRHQHRGPSSTQDAAGLTPPSTQSRRRRAAGSLLMTMEIWLLASSAACELLCRRHQRRRPSALEVHVERMAVSRRPSAAPSISSCSPRWFGSIR